MFDSSPSAIARPVIVFFHGGGFVLGCLDSYHNLCTDIAAQTGLPVVSVDYR
ncbi:MAG: alpha/beta hydrolase fold domain-containing protein, partial [Sphingomonadaceae bacterium]